MPISTVVIDKTTSVKKSWGSLIPSTSKRPDAPPPSSMNVSKCGQLFMIAWTKLTNPTSNSNVEDLMNAFEKSVNDANTERLLMAEVWITRLESRQEQSMGLSFETFPSASACEFIDLCDKTNVASAIDHHKGLPPGWEAFKIDGVDVRKQWRYVSPEKVEYFKLKGKGGAKEASKSIPITPEQDTSAMAVMSVSEPIKGKRKLSINLNCGFKRTVRVMYSDGTLCGILNSPIERDDECDDDSDDDSTDDAEPATAKKAKIVSASKSTIASSTAKS
jgi:hypothetical protein